MNVVILAAGVGKRLHPFTIEHPKCLLRFGGKSLLHRHLEMMEGTGAHKITIVVGYLADQIEAELRMVNCGAPIELIYNAQYRLGSALSLLQAQTAFRSVPAIIMDADLLFCRRLWQRLWASPVPDSLLVDNQFVDTGEEVKAVVRSDGTVCELGKQVSREGVVAGESVGIFKFSAEANNKLITALQRSVIDNPNVEYESVINGLLDQIQMRCVPVGDLPWIEIDFPHDADRAATDIWPAIMSREQTLA